MTCHRLLFLLALILILPAGIGCSLTGDDDDGGRTDRIARASFSFDVPVANQGALEVVGVNGTIRIDADPAAASVAIEGERRVGSFSRADAESYLRRVIVEVEDRSDRVRVRTEQPDDSDGRNVEVDYRITVPASWDLFIQHVNGTIETYGMEGHADVNLVNGTIQMDHALPFRRTLSIGLVNGTIDLTIPVATSASFAASVVNGSIVTSNLTLFDIVQTNRSLQGTLGEGGGSIRLDAVNGTITVMGRN